MEWAQKHILWRELTDVWAAEEAGSEADVTVPVGRMNSDVASDERRLEELLAFLHSVFVAGERL